ncbi:unnamed protein product [Enterobius vermicularis]|uniref:Pyridoxal kinase n=1 Tax=Enterobius vermicularis TaxID=51028 RepID=A0A0N4UWD3_ENTVE|nr:unnamed protein product [Enterobius vermicularis]
MGVNGESSSLLEALYNNPSENGRVLSIQSHVVHGYAGNKCSVFPLQLHGYEVDPLNSVQLSNHTGYKYVKGERLSDTHLTDLYEGLKLNDINNYSYILTGYCGTTSFLEKVADIVQDIKKKNPNVVYVCDPVLGDNGEYYTPKEMTAVYRDQILKLADVVTPNTFELSELTGLKIANEEDFISAVEKIHSLGVKSVVVTSGLETETTKFCYCSMKDDNGTYLRYRFHIPIVPGNYVGTGDVFTSLLVVWLDKVGGDLRLAVEKVISSIQGVLRRTNESSISKFLLVADLELRLVHCRVELLCPTIPILSERL